ncbi:uncharacterized protein LOC106166358 [Lingula anatina]|uniref:Uncharacterized protein LOC106166358 n=1 Tax=Lingula anatina TaxID=7574 RepID=A0A1S3IQ54_LINAN|nr:uncharacterized protein LOC106166358 [Lingula anatina]|eukprot:XP_013400347.1 uncharacterized protein LOC106166358 [Lingula anatina]
MSDIPCAVFLVFCVVSCQSFPKGEVKHCNPRGMQNLEPEKLTGIWYGYLWRRHPMVLDDRVLTEYAPYVTAAENGTLSILIEALPKDGQACIVIDELSSLQPTGQSGVYAFGPPESNNHFKIIDTDYINYSVVLVCYGEKRQGWCQKDAIQIWSRRVGLDPIYVYSGMKTIAQRLCKTFEGFRFSVHKLACNLRGQVTKK